MQNFRALGAPPQTPVPPAAGGFASKPPASGGWELRPLWPPAAGGSALRPLKSPPIVNFWLRVWLFQIWPIQSLEKSV